MKILVLSDMHLCGEDGEVDKFGWSDLDFIDKVENVYKKYNIDLIVLNGDIEDYYFYEEKDIKRKHSIFYDYLSHRNVIWLRGNHDENKNRKTSFCVNGVYIEHGDFGDFYGFHPLRILRDFRDKILDFIYMKVIKSLQKVYMYYFNKSKKLRNKHHRSSFSNLDYANRMFFEDDYKEVIIFGHTHVLQKVESFINGKKRVYLNSGTCSNKHFQGVVVDTESKDCFIFGD